MKIAIKSMINFLKKTFLPVVTLVIWIFLIRVLSSRLFELDTLKVLNYMCKHLITPAIMIITSYKLYKQWQYDKFVELNDRVIKAEDMYLKKMEMYYKYLNKELSDDIVLLESAKEHYMIEYLGELEFLSLAILKCKSVGYEIAKEHLQYIILSCFDENQQKDLAEYLRQTKYNNNEGYYKYLYQLYDLYRKEKM